jgi:hypothetical protein
MARKPAEKYKYIACTIYPGMLGNEYAVEIEVRGTTFSLFADKADVIVADKVPGDGLLRVMIQDARTNLISLPGDTLEQGLRFLEFPIDQLQSA